MKLIDKTTIKFILVGIVNTLVGTGVMFLMYNLLHASYWISSASNYIIGSIVSNEKSFAMIIKFVINISICYLAAYGVAKPLVRMVLSGASKSIQENLAMLVGMGLFVVLNYFGQRFIVFKKDEA